MTDRTGFFIDLYNVVDTTRQYMTFPPVVEMYLQMKYPEHVHPFTMDPAEKEEFDKMSPEEQFDLYLNQLLLAAAIADEL